jgi:hypothetical protein
VADYAYRWHEDGVLTVGDQALLALLGRGPHLVAVRQVFSARTWNIIRPHAGSCRSQPALPRRVRA